MPANISIPRLNSDARFLPSISDSNTAQLTPVGIPIRRAPRVTPRVPAISGKIPKSPFVGDQFVPKTKSIIPILFIAGNPEMNMNTVISTTVITETAPHRNINFCMNFSLLFICLPVSTVLG